MIISGSKLEKYLNYLLVFLLPTQLALHFWPNFSLVFGIRVDYLSPTIYLTDLLFVGLFINWIRKNTNSLKDFVYGHRVFFLALLGFLFMNILLSVSPELTFLKWIKIIELILFGFYVNKRKDVYEGSGFLISLFVSLVIVSLIGIFQVSKGGTIGGIFYLLGERSFNIYTPGIALQTFFEKIILRAYSFFPHPNVLAAYLGASLLMLAGWQKKGLWFGIGILIILVCFFLTFSLSASIAFFICATLLYFSKRKFSVSGYYLTAAAILLSLLFSVASRPIALKHYSLPESLSQRFDMAIVSGEIISTSFPFGSGLNTFIQESATRHSEKAFAWHLQPVHNFYLLIFSESGLIGILFLYFIFSKVFNNVIKTKDNVGCVILFFVLITSLFDHYWATLQQTQFLLALIIGKYLGGKPKMYGTLFP